MRWVAYTFIAALALLAAPRPGGESSPPKLLAALQGSPPSLTVSRAGTAFFGAGDPLLVPGGGPLWSSGHSRTLVLSAQLARSAGNDYMGCAPSADFVWVVR